MNHSPSQRIFEQAQRTPDHLALYAHEKELSYRELVQRISTLASGIRARGLGPGNRVGVLGARSQGAIEAVLASTWSGAAYVPLSTRWPAERLGPTLQRASLDALVVDEQGAARLTPDILEHVPLLLTPGTLPASLAACSEHQSLNKLPEAPVVLEPAELQAQDLAYIMFTSGTTGVPKGVMVAWGSALAYLDALATRKALTEQDRASQFTELSFDPSIGELYLPLWAGASLHVVPEVSSVSPVKFIQQQQLTVWGSTPAAIAWMRDTRSLQPDSLAGLRYSSFGGEPLTTASVHDWHAAAPNSVIDNLYGPTEATVDCCGQLLQPDQSPILTGERGILAIGTPHPGTELAVFSAQREQIADNEVGELGIAGAQVTLGYLDQPDLTRERFPTIDGKRWYLTGDLARRDTDGNFHHLGRADNQIKIHGYRVELEDIEAQLRSVSGADAVAAVAWPMRDGVAQGIAAFVTQSDLSAGTLRARLRARLPAHMVPGKITTLDVMPLNTAGKIDRAALVALLDHPQRKNAQRKDG